MKIVNLEIKKIYVNKFSIKSNEIELVINFNDGADKYILKNVKLSDQGAAEEILKDLRKMEKKVHSEFDGVTVIEDMVNVVLQEEDKLAHKIGDFLKKVSESLEKLRNTNVASGYLDLIREVKGKSLEF
jgi:argininosuccinate lyase